MKLRGPLTARYADYAPTFPAQVRTAAQRAGLRYEASVVKRLRTIVEKVEAGPWLVYRAANKAGICQPDALAWLSDKFVVVVEVKLTHQQNARPKLVDFYGPLVQKVHPAAEVAYLQVFKNTKPAAHKRLVPFYEIPEHMKPGKYRECQILL